jgi:8-hydroxy-5-deazaflavin:NADPH oxidoreductase
MDPHERRKEWSMRTAIFGVGNIGSAVAGHLVAGNELVVLAAQDESNAEAAAARRSET